MQQKFISRLKINPDTDFYKILKKSQNLLKKSPSEILAISRGAQKECGNSYSSTEINYITLYLSSSNFERSVIF